jgi:hypothetical protein
MLPDVLDFPVGQFVHDRVPGDAENVPDWHMPQLDAATAFENLRAAHKREDLIRHSHSNSPPVRLLLV